MAICGQKLWVNRFRKMTIFQRFKLVFFYSLERRFFVLKYYKRHFGILYCLIQKVGKMAFFGPKPRVHPFGKLSVFRLFKLLVFIA